MIPASHLRTTNKFIGIAGIQTVLEILDNTRRGKYKQRGYEHLIIPVENQIEIDGIPLNDGILINVCKFTKSENIYTKEIKGEKYELLLCLDGTYELSKFCAKIIYLHQLQNNWFWNTMAELEIDSDELKKHVVLVDHWNAKPPRCMIDIEDLMVEYGDNLKKFDEKINEHNKRVIVYILTKKNNVIDCAYITDLTYLIYLKNDLKTDTNLWYRYATNEEMLEYPMKTFKDLIEIHPRYY